ncbi:60Kd inner membrane protein-domain-containing protein [Aspergillus coremiiformis]|uniref:60Kd inner membrane protein-domain-containing protein n=1 Tax=Aspergillus coremiiformis TaxID=138285 RepID=A0A5N6ZEK0_9EURO|nr:60Kd inner membrane protein-domain-containing protein [Aspergillus coremiiformis]
MTLGGTGLRGIARQRLTAFSRSSRSMSSFRSQVSSFPTRYGNLNQSLAGNLSWRTASSVHQLSAARFNSTASSFASTATAPATTTSDAVDTTFSGLSDLDINTIPDRIGYLKDLGLDYGWGLSSVVEFFIEHFHVWGGLPWWASIVATSILLRVALLKPSIEAVDVSARMQNNNDTLTRLRGAVSATSRENNPMKSAEAKAELVQFLKDKDIQYYKAFFPLIQVPFGFCFFRVVRGMADLPVPGLAAESVGWLKDLTVADPFFLLPLTAAVSMFLSFKKTAATKGASAIGTPSRKLIMYGLPGTSLLFMAFFPSALQLYFATSALFGLGQAYLISSESFRRFANMTPQDPQAGMTITEEKTEIRMLNANKAIEIKDESPIMEPGPELSFIDRVINNIKKSYSDITNDLKEKVDSAMSSEVKKNADGTPAEPPRLSEKDRKLADSYEQRRKEEDNWNREERNHARREAHYKALEQKTEKARSASKDSRQR